MTAFVGTKAAFVCGDHLLTYLRDDHAGLPWAGWWDLPGGGREGAESAEDCLLREMQEEFGLRLGPERLLWRRVFPSFTVTGAESVFFAGRITQAEIAAIAFGDEGQRWEMMPVAAFLAHERAVPELQRRAGIALAALGAG